MRNKILRSANAKYHYSYFFFYIINKGNLPLMHSCVFWCEFITMNRLTGVKQKHRKTSKVSLLYLFYRKISKNNDI